MSLASLGHIATKERLAGSRWLGVGVLAALHLTAVGILAWTEYDWVGPAIFMLAWALLNFIFIALLRRPAISAALSLCLFVAVIMLSQLKFSILWMVINFFDVLIVDSDTVAFLLSIFPDLRIMAVIGVLIVVPALVLIWRIDPFRVRRLGGAARRSRVFDCDHCLGACGAGRALGAVPGHQSRFDLRSLRRDHGL